MGKILFHLRYVNWTFVNIVASSSKPTSNRKDLGRGKSYGPAMTTRKTREREDKENFYFISHRKSGMVVRAVRRGEIPFSGLVSPIYFVSSWIG